MANEQWQFGMTRSRLPGTKNKVRTRYMSNHMSLDRVPISTRPLDGITGDYSGGCPYFQVVPEKHSAGVP